MSTPSPWDYFSVEELSCPCCGVMGMNADAMAKFVKLRQFYGPLHVNSAYRCPKHDAAVGTSTTPGAGPHTLGRAIDFKIPAGEADAFMALVYKTGLFTGKGLDERQSIADGARFIHLDDLGPGEFPAHVRPALWSYP